MNNNCRFQASWLSLLLIHDENNNNETVIYLVDGIYRYVFILISSMGWDNDALSSLSML